MIACINWHWHLCLHKPLNRQWVILGIVRGIVTITWYSPKMHSLSPCGYFSTAPLILASIDNMCVWLLNLCLSGKMIISVTCISLFMSTAYHYTSVHSIRSILSKYSHKHQRPTWYWIYQVIIGTEIRNALLTDNRVTANASKTKDTEKKHTWQTYWMKVQYDMKELRNGDTKALNCPV